ncbi:MAG: DUF5676 family membrane protein [Candidatus Nanoarchaeia archaeon]
MKKETVHYIHPTGLALSITAGIVYTACAVLFWLFPSQTIIFFNNWSHGINLAQIATTKTLTLGGFFVGLLCVMIFTYIVGAFYAFIYNKCVIHCKNKGWL